MSTTTMAFRYGERGTVRLVPGSDEWFGWSVFDGGGSGLPDLSTIRDDWDRLWVTDGRALVRLDKLPGLVGLPDFGWYAGEFGPGATAVADMLARPADNERAPLRALYVAWAQWAELRLVPLAGLTDTGAQMWAAVNWQNERLAVFAAVGLEDGAELPDPATEPADAAEVGLASWDNVDDVTVKLTKRIAKAGHLDGLLPAVCAALAVQWGGAL